MIFSRFGIDFQPKKPFQKWSTNTLESISNRKSRKSKKWHLQSFLLVFLVPRGAEKHEKSRKNDSKMRTKIYRFFQPILKRFLLDFPPIWDPKISKSQPKSHAKSKQKNHFKMIPKISILASKMDYFFAVFSYQNRPLEAPWAHQGVQTENHLQN